MAVDLVIGHEVQNAFCAVRPPGHHAERANPMGFCFFNNIAVAAAHALEVHGLERVAVIDFDVHHGNGTTTSDRDAPASARIALPFSKLWRVMSSMDSASILPTAGLMGS
jgi:acetoin utilization deacetylase AcuC-like enzyme